MSRGETEKVVHEVLIKVPNLLISSLMHSSRYLCNILGIYFKGEE